MIHEPAIVYPTPNDAPDRKLAICVPECSKTIREHLQRQGCKDENLPGLPKGEKSRVALARRLRQETTTSPKWIACRLHMGSWILVPNLLHEK